MPPSRARQALQKPEPTVFEHCPSYNACSAYARLVTITSKHGETISSCWHKKNTAARSEWLRCAWKATFGKDSFEGVGKEIPERHPRLSEEIFQAAKKISGDQNPLDTVSMDHYLLSNVINIEELTSHPAAFLGLLEARTCNSPGELGWWDYLIFIEPTLNLFGKKVNDGSIVVIGNGDEEYGVIKAWPPESEDYRQGILSKNAISLDPDGILLMKWQTALLEFCLNCVKIILNSELNGEEPEVEDTASSKTASKMLFRKFKESRAHSDLRLNVAYSAPKTFDFNHANDIVKTLMGARQDHVVNLRSDATYLLSEVEKMLKHRHKYIPDFCGESGKPRPENVVCVLKILLYSTYSELILWNEIALLFEEAADLHITGGRGDREVLYHRMHTIKSLIRGLEKNIDHQMVYIIAHKYKDIYETDPIDELLLRWCVGNIRNKWESQVFSLRRISDEIQQIYADKPELEHNVDPWIMNSLDTLAQIYELQDAVNLYHPTMATFMPDWHYLIDSIQATMNSFAATEPELNLDMLVKGDDGLAALENFITVEGGLDLFWSTIDKEVAKLSEGSRTLQDWVSASQGKLAKKRKRQWTWKGQTWFAPEVEQEDELEHLNLGSVERPKLIPVEQYDDSLGYGKDTFLITEFPPRPPQPVVQPRSRPLQQIQRPRPSQRTPLPVEPSRPFGEAADGSHGAVLGPIPPPKAKIKTTKAPSANAPVAEVPTITEGEQIREKPKHYVSKRVYNLLTELSNPVGPMGWKDFQWLMVQLGFSVEPGSGSAVRFKPASETDEPICFHKPHPKQYLKKKGCKKVWKRLHDHYLWEMDRFEVREKETETEKEIESKTGTGTEKGKEKETEVEKEAEAGDGEGAATSAG